MSRIISAPDGCGTAEQELGSFWGRYFAEIPTCSHEDCSRIAHDVDPFFPYLDDRNRCHQHRDIGEESSGQVLS